MSLDKERLKASIATKIQTAIGAEPGADMLIVPNAIAEAIVDEIVANATVNPTSLQDSVPAPVTGTGTIS